ncbi:histone-lysine N-methyltransferase EHMT2 isoform X2 [Latimeria chalumnae]|uniref:histone-lysine N-methyltransferase EHMT2 isoform X2 n=1 Tax=Latimeria chalumnae TaxID=7897 RepID=UPI00313F018B
MMAAVSREGDPKRDGKAGGEGKVSTSGMDLASPVERGASADVQLVYKETEERPAVVATASEIGVCSAQKALSDDLPLGEKAEAKDGSAMLGDGKGAGSKDPAARPGEGALDRDVEIVELGAKPPAAVPVPKGISGHAAKTFPASPSKVGGTNRAKMSLTGTSKSPTSVHSLAMKLLSMPGSRLACEIPGLGMEALPTSTAAQPAAQEGKPKIHRARKTMPKPGRNQMRNFEKKVSATLSDALRPTLEGPLPLKDPEAGCVKKRKLESDSSELQKRMSLMEEGLPEKSNCREVREKEAGFPEDGGPASAGGRKPSLPDPSLKLSQEPEADAGKEEAAEPMEDWEAEVGEDFSLFYDSYSADGRVDSDSKSEGERAEDRLSELEEEDEEEEDDEGGESGNQSDRSSASSSRKEKKKKWRNESPWVKPSRKRKKKERVKPSEDVNVEGVGLQVEYTEVPLGSLDLPGEENLSPHNTGVSNDASSMETDKFEELPLCSCRMEAPKIDRISELANNKCMATESINGELSGCSNSIVKRETMRPSSRVPLMVLCESHRAKMVKHQCCPGCGYFCTAGTFLECHPDFRITHRFHKTCVSQLNGMIFCPHCGEDASEAQEITIAKADTSTPVPAPAPQGQAGDPTGRTDTTHPSARMRGNGEAKKSVMDPLADGIDSSGPSLTLPSGAIISAVGIPPGPGREALEKALVVQESERRKKLRFHPRQLYLSSKQGELQKVVLMLHNLDPNFQTDQASRRTCLHVAAQKGYLEICHVLLQAGAKIDVYDKTLRTPLLEAVASHHVKLMKYLVRRGACVYTMEQDGSTCLHHAAKSGNLEMVHFLLSTGQVDINAQDNGGWTPIIWAAEHRHIEAIKMLLARGADVTLRDNEENICLHWASFAGSADIAEVLLNAQCDLHAVNFHGDTPLHIAAREGYHDCVILFLSRGADIDIPNKEGDSPLDLALESTDVWFALQLNRKLKQGIANRSFHTEKIISRDIARGYEKVPIPCVNAVDMEPCPEDYKYISENCETSTMNIDRNITHLQHCSCLDDCSSSNCLCGQLSIRCWYDKDRRLLQEFNKIEPPLIFECNQACTCWRTCKNRVVQEGIKVRLQLYRTAKMGWGVRALQDIPQGTFICEYVGELISDAEADVREDDSYLFDLDNKDGEVYCIDARYYGNISRFINHLCDPNIIPVRVFMLHQDLRFPRIAFFSSRDIKSGEELGFDYGDRFWDIKSKYFTCQCGSEKCKHSAEAIAQEQSRLARLEAYQETVPETGPLLLGNP